MSKELVEIVRCKNCIHRPIKGERDENRHLTYPPEDSRGYADFTCPCLNEDDYWYSWYPSDEWFCAEGEAKGDKNGNEKKDRCIDCENFNCKEYYADNTTEVSPIAWGSCTKCQRNFVTIDPYNQVPSWCPNKKEE